MTQTVHSLLQREHRQYSSNLEAAHFVNVTLNYKEKLLSVISLLPMQASPIFVLQFAVSIIHGSGRAVKNREGW